MSCDCCDDPVTCCQTLACAGGSPAFMDHVYNVTLLNLGSTAGCGGWTTLTGLIPEGPTPGAFEWWGGLCVGGVTAPWNQTSLCGAPASFFQIFQVNGGCAHIWVAVGCFNGRIYASAGIAYGPPVVVPACPCVYHHVAPCREPDPLQSSAFPYDCNDLVLVWDFDLSIPGCPCGPIRVVFSSL